MRDFLETWTREIIIAGLALCALGWYLYPIFNKNRDGDYRPTCPDNVRQIVLAVQIWQQDHEQKYPDAVNFWAEMLFPPRSSTCPTYTRSDKNDYGFHAALGNKTLTDLGMPTPDKLLVIADAATPDNLLHKRLDVDFRHGTMAFIGFADGHVEKRRPRWVQLLPEPAPPEPATGEGTLENNPL